MSVKRGNNLGLSDDSSFGSRAVGGILLSSIVFMRGVDGDLDGDGTTTDLLALESVDSFLLFSLITNINETISLASSGFSPPPSDDASVIDPEARISEESSEAGVVDVEAKVGDEENGLGRFANWILTGGTRGTRGPGFALPGPGNALSGRIRGVCGGGGLSFARPDPFTALKAGLGRW